MGYITFRNPGVIFIFVESNKFLLKWNSDLAMWKNKHAFDFSISL